MALNIESDLPGGCSRIADIFASISHQLSVFGYFPIIGGAVMNHRLIEVLIEERPDSPRLSCVTCEEMKSLEKAADAARVFLIIR